jgi:acyl dehydratase
MPDSTLKERPPCPGVPGRTFEQFTVGERIEHARALPVTMADNVAFCRLTLNRQPLHLDEAAARAAGFPGVLVNGLYTFSACVGASVEDTTAGTLVANLGYQDVEHPEPVFPGDTLRFATEVVDKRPSSKPGRGIVTLRHTVRNQHGREVCRFRRTVMVRAGGA